MATLIKWKIQSLEVVINESQLQNVVRNVHWRCEASEQCEDKDCADEYIEYTASKFGCVALNYPKPENFVKFESLQETQVVDWVKAAIDGKAVEESLIEEIENQKDPKLICLRQPWLQNEEQS